MPTPIDDGANFPTAPSLPTESEAGEAILYTPAAPIIKKEDEGVNFPAVPAQGEAGNAVQEHIMPTTPIKTEDYDADKEENFHAPRPSRDREKRRRVDDGDAVDGAGNHDWVDDGGENGKRSPSVRECGNVEHQRGEQDGEYPSSANGGTILACGRVDDGGVQSHHQHTGQQLGGVQVQHQSSVEFAPDGSDADRVDHVLREDYDIFDGNIAFCCQNCR